MTSKAYVVGPHYGAEVGLAQSLGYEITDDHTTADLVIFTGGQDVDPDLYGERALRGTAWNRRRDEEELEIFEALSESAVKVGICRGAQFLCVAHGGKLWQDVDKHTVGESGHWMQVIGPDYVKAVGGERIDVVNSYHHQALRLLPKEWDVLGACSISKNKVSYSVAACDGLDIEIAASIKDRAFAFQPHPEFHDNETRRVFLEMMRVFLDKIRAADAEAAGKKVN